MNQKTVLVYSDLLLDDLCAIEYLSQLYDRIYLVPVNINELEDSDYSSDTVRNLDDVEKVMKQWFQEVKIFENGIGTNNIEVDLVVSLANVTQLVSDFKDNSFLKKGGFTTIAMIGESKGKNGCGEEWNACQDEEAYKELFSVCPNVLQYTKDFCEKFYEAEGYPFEAQFLNEYIKKMNALNDSVCCYDLMAVHFGIMTDEDSLKKATGFISTSLFKNCRVFFNEAIKHFNLGIKNYDNKIIAIILTQMTLELAIKYIVVSYYDVRDIFEDNYVKNLSDKELFEGFINNSLRVKEFEKLKNYLKSKRDYSTKLSNEFEYMDKFQNYRNKLVHQNYNFSETEDESLKNDLIHIFVNVIHVLLSSDIDDEEYRTLVFEYIDLKEYEKLTSDKMFFDELTRKFYDEYEDLYLCPICDTKSMTPFKKCFRCLRAYGDSNSFEFVECSHCREKMVIADALNIDYQSDNCMRGLCLNCQEDTIVYKCPKCKNFYNLEDFLKDHCQPFGDCLYD